MPVLGYCRPLILACCQHTGCSRQHNAGPGDLGARRSAKDGRRTKPRGQLGDIPRARPGQVVVQRPPSINGLPKAPAGYTLIFLRTRQRSAGQLIRHHRSISASTSRAQSTSGREMLSWALPLAARLVGSGWIERTVRRHRHRDAHMASATAIRNWIAVKMALEPVNTDTLPACAGEVICA